MLARGTRGWLRGAALGLLVLLQAGCAPPGSTSLSSPAQSAPVDDGATKTLVLAQLNPIRVFGPWGTGNTVGGGVTLMGVHSAGLVSMDGRGSASPRIALAVPSFEDGSITVLPDGRMQTTWRLRSDVTWQDGQPFTAEDVVFSHRLLTDPALPGATGISRFIERAEASDPATVTFTWKTTLYNALFLNFSSFWLLPHHLLAKPYEEDSKEAFLAEPYFTTDYLNLGPFRLTDWGLGQELTFERYNGYFLGRPKVGKIIIDVITDENVIAAGLRAGKIDLVPEKAFNSTTSLALRDEWSKSGEGTVVSRQTNWYYMQFQWDTQWARPVEVPRDVRLRIALYEALDRAALRDFLFPGIPDTNADTFLTAGDARSAVVGQPFARYAYDPARAERELVEAGWSRGADGRFLDRAGNRVQLEIWAFPADVPPMQVIAADWRKIGIEAKEYPLPPQLTGPAAERSQFPGLYLAARGASESIVGNFSSFEIATPENRWNGFNRASYSNPMLDRLNDQLVSTLDSSERGKLLKQAGEFLADELPGLPMYWQINFLELRDTVRGPVAEDYQHMTLLDNSGSEMARNAHLWDHI
ncbi:MAG TPA: ABC transporter substrate-binding protein [Chloroflexota bacterium]